MYLFERLRWQMLQPTMLEGATHVNSSTRLLRRFHSFGSICWIHSSNDGRGQFSIWGPIAELSWTHLSLTSQLVILSLIPSNHCFHVSALDALRPVVHMHMPLASSPPVIFVATPRNHPIANILCWNLLLLGLHHLSLKDLASDSAHLIMKIVRFDQWFGSSHITRQSRQTLEFALHLTPLVTHIIPRIQPDLYPISLGVPKKYLFVFVSAWWSLWFVVVSRLC